ncbi:hypothetical protein HYW20_03665 [Candidatus Woesearchaeota archaeon]|nr:hypothetical protein [Candidatus Woesearchaeota archaeon]
MLYKKSVELSLNFMVILIISIVLFGFGIKFISDLSSSAKDITDMTTEELDEQISSLICEGSDRVCIGQDRRTIKRGDFGVFGLKIMNVLDSRSFDVTITPADPIGYKKDKTPISPPSPLLTINPSSRSINIEKNEERSLGIGIQVPPNAVSGTYILDIDILNGGNTYSKQKFYVDVP